MSWHVQTQAFSGPFDLLLTLVSRQKVAIGSISISEVADQYLAEVQRMGEMDLDVASDFVLVASTLLEMKAAALVPQGQEALKDAKSAEDDLDEDEDLAGLAPDEAREVLIARLITYKQFRNAASALGARAEAESRMFPRTVGPDPEFLNLMPNYLEGISLRSLAVICADLDSRRETFLLESEHIAPRRLPIALTVSSVDRLLRSRKHMTFSELTENSDSPEVVVANFLAVLDLFKRGKLLVSQKELFGEIELEHVEGATPYEMDESVIEELHEMGEGELADALSDNDEYDGVAPDAEKGNEDDE
ncbi:MAG: segregation and condensation protein A [Tractidigestivibacter sp.]|jgi:segregation and condensation protein A|uniref:segregation and condensation protein A n=1 Tax=Tractidigestivibacter sp. TaxID=2847320 RepID=UPI003D8BE8BA